MSNYDEILSRMEQRYQELSGFVPAARSDLGLRLRVLAYEVDRLGQRQQELQEQVDPRRATGEFLDLHALTRGLTRKEASSAQGTLLFQRSSPATYAIQIPAGTVCSTAAGEHSVRFSTLEDGAIQEGETQASLPAACLTPGEVGNVAAGTVQTMVTPVQGISSVTNQAPFSGGSPKETDDALRGRLLESYRTISNGANAAYYYQIAMSYEGVHSAKVLPRNRGRGTVDVVIATSTGTPGQDLLDTIAARLQQDKEIAVDVKVLPCQEVTVPITVAVSPQDSTTLEAVKAQIQQSLAQWFLDMQVGEPLLMAALVSRIYQVPGVANCAITAPTEDTLPEEDEILRLGTVTVTQMGG